MVRVNLCTEVWYTLWGPPAYLALHIWPPSQLTSPYLSPSPVPLTRSSILGPLFTWTHILTCLYPLQEAALRAYYINEDPRDFQLQALPLTTLSGNAQVLGKAGTTEEEANKSPGSRNSMPEAWVIRSLPRAQEILKIYPAWLK